MVKSEDTNIFQCSGLFFSLLERELAMDLERLKVSKGVLPKKVGFIYFNVFKSVKEMFYDV